MVDRAKRDLLAQALRQLISGRIDNLQFDDLDDERLQSDDRVIHEIFYSMWLHYDDFRSHALSLTEGQRLDFVRCILFLHSDLEFEWYSPKRSIIREFWTRVIKRSGEVPIKMAEAGNMEVFPFFRKANYEEALKTPRLLKHFKTSCAL